LSLPFAATQDETPEQRREFIVVFKIKTTVLKIGRRKGVGDLEGEPFETLVKCINEAWKAIPPECRETSGFELSELTVWYHRPETEEDKRDRLEYERLKAKFANIEYTRVSISELVDSLAPSFPRAR
jgi:hypothetical protein